MWSAVRINAVFLHAPSVRMNLLRMDCRSTSFNLTYPFNTRRGILRGMHFQADPHPEGKLVRCTRGAIWDVVIDLRSGSPSYRQWIGVELTEKNARALYIPEGCAHGFQTLTDDSEVLYLMSEFYYPELARGVRWNDRAFGIEWPIADAILSDRDASYPDVAP
jgi:dTDP-4-dehydrorhamnose 3,5-epimerase